MAKLADASALGADAARHVGSTPTLPTMKRIISLLILVAAIGGISWFVSQRPGAQAPAPITLESAMRDCPDASVSCLTKEILSATQISGPTAGTALLEALQKQGGIPPSEDDHQISHKIGRKTAEVLGMTGEAFVSCPTSYNYGCQHGFFEYALGRSESPKNAAESICESLVNTHSEKYIFYCYHGVGHGVLMATAYDLDKGIATCDSFGTARGRDGCWQGLFMENVNAAMRGEARTGVFSAEDPLAPCNGLEEQYRHECFINHAGWLMNSFGNDVAKGTRACLKAPDPNSEHACVESVGLMVTNPSWQINLAQGMTGTNEEIAWALCTKFPAEHVGTCVVGGVDNIMNFDELKTDRAVRFCSLVEPELRSTCAERIGLSLKQQTTADEAVVAGCVALPEEMRTNCLRGAGHAAQDSRPRALYRQTKRKTFGTVLPLFRKNV